MKNYIYWITFVAVNGGLLFGLNMAGISGAVTSIKQIFSLTDNGIGIVVGSIMLGCLIGALVAGSLADKYGRKQVMVLISLIFIFSSIGCALAQSSWILILSRFISGIGVGLVSVVCPMYISEVAPAEKRGRLVSYFQFAITLGILLAYVFNFIFAGMQDSWRFMLGIPFVFGSLFLLFLLISFPESPRWLIARKKSEEALKVLTRIGGVDFAKKECKEIENSISSEKNKEKVKVSEIFKGKVGGIVFLGICLAIFQQLSGINAVVNYAPVIFEKIGFGKEMALLQSVLVGVINFLATILALWLVDSKGRKSLLLWGAIGMTVSLAYLALSFAFGWSSVGILISLLMYILFYAASFAPVFWVITSEIFPNRVRAVALSFTTAVIWFSSFLAVQFSPFILNKFGGAFLFGLFGLVSLIAFLFVYYKIPETKGKSLEEIEKELGL
ncbi:MAG: sugar porter family MFS transporter [Bacteroidales bacterium]|nr:sugar porter family MFS transporter [Bacteroidales bacterium]